MKTAFYAIGVSAFLAVFPNARHHYLKSYGFGILYSRKRRGRLTIFVKQLGDQLITVDFTSHRLWHDFLGICQNNPETQQRVL